ncbi:MAG TPA: trehalose-phosphatase, partial [Mycobacteriales bacterium]|nr:trehalose-phosphatase [Mycobacteriales bacterium]
LEALRALTARIGCCAVVTGRAAIDAVRLGGLAEVPRLHVLGHYGLERWYAGQLDSPDAVPAVARARDRLRGLVAAAPAGVHLEDKGHSLVVHTRPATDPAAALADLRAPVDRLAAELGLEVVPGRFVLELRPSGIDKGAAVRRLAADRDPAAMLYLGDDLGDLPAYAAVESLRREGIPGLTVASVDPRLDDAPPQLAARADLVLGGPEQVVAFLTALAAAVGEP